MKLKHLRSNRLAWLLAGLIPYAYLAVAQTLAPPKPTFTNDIAPILKAHCVSCHSGSSPAGGLDLSSPAGLQKGGTSGKLFVPGDPRNSLIVRRLLGTRVNSAVPGSAPPQMPIGMPPLAARDIDSVKEWIASGAKFEGDAGIRHWAYVGPKPPKVPNLGSSWVRNPIDAFVLQRLRKEGLHPSPTASKETLIRRVTLDLIGLPPTTEEVAAFVADPSPNAYDKVVDRLLASPHYGERQAREWLDLARYADSDGYEKDLNRTAWRYRDWVIDAFNHNMPYDEFTIEQIAGDMLPSATLSERIATGFNRNTMFNREGGVNAEEAHFAVLLDRVDTTATVWLGTTLQCARCHDHKYDPFTQRDYYKMLAFFSNGVVNPGGSKQTADETWFEPQIPVPTAEQATQKAKLTTELAQLKDRMTKPDPDVDRAYADWKQRALQPVAWTPLALSLVASAGGATLSVGPDGTVKVEGRNPDSDTYKVSSHAPSEAVTGIRLEAISDAALPHGGPGRSAGGNFVVTDIHILADGEPVHVADVAADYFEPRFDPGRIFGKGGENRGWSIWPQVGKTHELWIGFRHPLAPGAKISITLDQHSPFAQHQMGRFRIAATTTPDPSPLLLTARVKDLLSKSQVPPQGSNAPAPQGLGASGPSGGEADEKELSAFFRSRTRILSKVRDEIADCEGSLNKLNAEIPTALVLAENPAKGPLTAWVRHRGEFGSKTEEVTAGTPAVLPPMAVDKANRLALGRWLVSKQNPLTARVQVNRMWEQVFGHGIVDTSEDFGTRGGRPTHPELLDWLACEFMAKGWDMKALNRLIVGSSTYRQSSATTAALVARDPEDLLYTRGPRFRLDAEAIHDTALAASGLLTRTVGGPSVYPYQPEGTWDIPASGEKWMPSKGADRYRRGIYTFAKRTAPYPAFTTMDSTSREFCTVRRIRTNTPLQALELLNDRLMIDAAKALGRRMVIAGKTDDARIAVGFAICTARKPQTTELKRLKALLAQLRAKYNKSPKSASALGANPDAAAYTVMANVLLNLDETITKE